jgi:hypothetical protein
LSNYRKNAVRNYSIVGAVILLVAIAVMIVRPLETTALEILLLLAGISFGALLFRFETKGWLAGILSLVVFLTVLFLAGGQGLGWIAGYIAGSNFGIAWRLSTRDKKPNAPWTVNNEGYQTAEAAGDAALWILRYLDGSRKNWRLSIQNDTARFDASGSSEVGILCHRVRFGKKVDPWTILEHPERAGSEVEVPMGGSPGYIPSQYVSNLVEAEAALKKFLEDPNAEAWGSEWDAGDIAEDLHIG